MEAQEIIDELSREEKRIKIYETIEPRILKDFSKNQIELYFEEDLE